MSSKNTDNVNFHTEKLVTRSQLGDAEAFGSLYELYADEMYRFALWYIGDEVKACDAVSDAVCNAFSAVRGLKNAASFKPWIFRILSNCCRKYLREKINARTVIPVEEQQELLVCTDCAENTELWAAVYSLSEEDRQILLLSVLGGYKSSEIGQMLSMPSGTVRSRLSRSLVRLKNKMSG